MFRLIILSLISIFVITGCYKKKDDKIRIAVSKEKSTESNTKYSDWILHHDSTIDLVYMYPMGIDSALVKLKSCNGLLLTGGQDIFPGYYGKIDDTARCGSIDRYRDSLEMLLIDAAMELEMPIFGVCRGEQILNVSQGGTLYIDIPSDYDTTVEHHNSDWSLCYHPVLISEGSQLSDICGDIDDNQVVTNHHQGIEKLGNNLSISAWSADSLPEAIEWKRNSNHRFIMAVQWHPEVMSYDHRLSSPLAKAFIAACEINSKKH
ncbi:MAG: gamma-glutamyl-gamma-aminobutyrate hydrolase family protein [Bacteroidales bacterium]|jgi:putative glutamine amidotransferase|nr:gamma-glutamyl-gamma-aminobutyrate hydrolase family protein [Bacteroidales bacterium]